MVLKDRSPFPPTESFQSFPAVWPWKEKAHTHRSDAVLTEVLCHPASFWRDLGWSPLSRNAEWLITGRTLEQPEACG